MKIKVALLDIDQAYLNRITNVLEGRYSNKLEIYCFTDPEKAIASLTASGINVFLASTTYEISTKNIPQQCGFAYLTESQDAEIYNNQKAISKFQKVDLFYSSILAVCSDIGSENITSSTHPADQYTPLYVFTSASGGVGTSSVAVACAISVARRGKKPLYLNLENFGTSNIYFHSESQNDLRDVFIALKSGKANVALKLESCVQRDGTGVFYISSPKNALDVCNLTADDIESLLVLCRQSGLFDCIVVDINYSGCSKEIAAIKYAKSVVFVSDGSELSNNKFTRAYDSMAVLTQQNSISLLGRLVVFYNKFSNKSGKHIDIAGLRVIGGAPRYEQTTAERIIQNLADNEAFVELDSSEVK